MTLKKHHINTPHKEGKKREREKKKTLQNTRAFFITLFLMPDTETVANPCSSWTKGNPQQETQLSSLKKKKKRGGKAPRNFIFVIK